MPIFVHVQAMPGVTAAQVEQEWGSTSTPEPVPSGPKGLFVVTVDVFGAEGQADATLLSHVPAVTNALKATYGTSELAALSTAEFELLAKGQLVNISVRKQGLVLTTKAGVVAASSWPQTLNAQSIAETVQRAADTLANATALTVPART